VLTNFFDPNRPDVVDLLAERAGEAGSSCACANSDNEGRTEEPELREGNCGTAPAELESGVLIRGCSWGIDPPDLTVEMGEGDGA
jgi:hypothetical protein